MGVVSLYALNLFMQHMMTQIQFLRFILVNDTTEEKQSLSVTCKNIVYRMATLNQKIKCY